MQFYIETPVEIETPYLSASNRCLERTSFSKTVNLWPLAHISDYG